MPYSACQTDNVSLKGKREILLNESLSFGVSKASQNLMTESVINGVSGKMGACCRRKTVLWLC